MTLDTYKKKRNFTVTPEPSGAAAAKAKAGAAKKATEQELQFVVQKHRATSLHYVFLLEHNGVLLSWAVPKGPSLDPSVKRLAMQVEDHPLDYGGFEGTIPEGEYGGGTVMVWDQGTWTPQNTDIDEALKKGDLKFTLHGKKLHGSWVLVRTRGFAGSDKSWLLIKHRDEFASTEDITTKEPRSVLTKRLMVDIAREGGRDVEKAATGDPGAKSPATKSGGANSARAKAKPRKPKR
jgi:bifunctional non-homologous end joining protein LigD